MALSQLSFIPNPRFEEVEVEGSSALCLVHLGFCGHSWWDGTVMVYGKPTNNDYHGFVEYVSLTHTFMSIPINLKSDKTLCKKMLMT